MKSSFSIILLVLSLLNVSAQKQTYYVFAYTQKMTKDIVCGQRELILDKEIELTTADAAVYKKNYEAELGLKYNSKNKYKNTYVELVKPNQSAIFYEGEKTYNQKTDGFDCTSTFYGSAVGENMAIAEQKFASLQLEYKKSVYKEIKRWSKAQITSSKAEDLAINWKKTKEGIVAILTNTRKDIAFVVEIKSLKSDTKDKSKIDYSKMTVYETKKITIQPGEKRILNLNSADDFTIDFSPVSSKKDENSLIDSAKHYLKQFITKPKKGEPKKISSVGESRG